MGASIEDIQEGACVRACLQDDRAAIEALYRAFSPRLVRLLRRRVRDVQLAEDLAQETLIKALKNLDRFDPSRPLWPWLRTIALNLVIDHSRKAGPEVPCQEIYDSTTDPAESMDEWIMLDQALGTLPGRHRAALSLRYLNDWKPTEAAQFLGMSRPAFDQLLSRAKRRLSVEYRRMSSGLQAILLLRSARFRALLQNALGRVTRRVHGASAQVPQSLFTSVSQVLTATAVVITAVASGTGSLPLPVHGGGRVALHDNVGATRSHHAKDPGAGRMVAVAAPTADGSGTGSTRTTARGGWNPDEPKTLDQKTNEIVDPNKNVDDPEDATITSFALGSDDGSVAYAAGKAHCRAACPPVLFGSKDGGATWDRLPAEGLDGTEIAAPRGTDSGETLFAMGSSGLQVSRDGGLTFGPALASGTPMITGSLAVSPEFSTVDPTVLVGAGTLFRYSDSTGLMDPYIGSLNGPFEPAFSPRYMWNDLFYLGAVRSGGAGELSSAVYTCNPSGCVYNALPAGDMVPRVRPVESDTDLVYAFTETGLFVSRGSNVHFRRLSIPAQGPRLLDLMPLDQSGRLLAAVASVKPSEEDGLYASTDGGRTWSRTNSELLRSGTTTLATAGNKVFVALRGGGLACSNDGGRTFERRCSH